MIEQQTIREIADTILGATPRGTKVILFGSYARGDAREQSDVDLLVVEPELGSRVKETGRLLRLLRPLRVSTDLIVTTRQWFDYWKDTPNTLSFEVNREGKVLGEAS